VTNNHADTLSLHISTGQMLSSVAMPTVSKHRKQMAGRKKLPHDLHQPDILTLLSPCMGAGA